MPNFPLFSWRPIQNRQQKITNQWKRKKSQLPLPRNNIEPMAPITSFLVDEMSDLSSSNMPNDTIERSFWICFYYCLYTVWKHFILLHIILTMSMRLIPNGLLTLCFNTLVEYGYNRRQAYIYFILFILTDDWKVARAWEKRVKPWFWLVISDVEEPKIEDTSSPVQPYNGQEIHQDWSFNIYPKERQRFRARGD